MCVAELSVSGRDEAEEAGRSWLICPHSMHDSTVHSGVYILPKIDTAYQGIAIGPSVRSTPLMAVCLFGEGRGQGQGKGVRPEYDFF